MARPLLIADVPWLLYRSFFALPKSIVGADGRPVNALLGTVNALLSAIDAHPPRAVVACLGAEEASYRVALLPRYHAHREPMPEPLAAQWQRAPALLGALGWTVFDAGDLEADDAMGSFSAAETASRGAAAETAPRGAAAETASRGAAAETAPRGAASGGAGEGGALLLSGDRDLYQAVGGGAKVLEMKGKEGIALLGEEEVRRRAGVKPALIPDLIALRGDPSDGIPGAPGVGAKIAALLLSQHRSLEGVIAAAEAQAAGTPPRDGAPRMRPKVAASIAEQADLLRTFKDVATLRRIDVTLPGDAPTDFRRGAGAAQSLGMQRLAARLRALAKA